MQASTSTVDEASLIMLEEGVWEALAAGDMEAMRASMADDFVYASGHGFVVGAGVHHEEADRAVDLGPREPDAGGVMHGLDHVVDEPLDLRTGQIGRIQAETR